MLCFVLQQIEGTEALPLPEVAGGSARPPQVARGPPPDHWVWLHVTPSFFVFCVFVFFVFFLNFNFFLKKISLFIYFLTIFFIKIDTCRYLIGLIWR
jgi:hypothetical protein